MRVDDNTPDLYVEDDGARGGNGSIRALAADGQQKWIWPSAPSDQFPLLIAADDQGGAFYLVSQNTPGPFDTYCYYGRVDQNGNETWQYQASNCQDDYAIHPDGTIFLVEPDFQATNATVVVALDPTTGQIKFTIPAPGNSLLGRMSISSDGSLYLPFSTNVDLQMMVIQSDGSYTTQQLDSIPVGAPGRAIPDGQGGILLVVSSSASSPTGTLYHSSASGTLKFNLPFTPVPPGELNSIITDDTMLLGQDGTAYLVASSSDTSFADTVEAIDTNSGAMKWTAVTPGAYSNLGLVTSDGSLAFQYYPTSDFSQHFAIASSTGQVSPLFANPADGSDAGPVITHLASPRLPSYWTLGTWHAFQNDGSLTAVSGPLAFIAGSEDPQPGSNGQKQHEPSYCQRSHCVLAPHTDTTIASDPLHGGAPLRKVEYEVFSLKNGVLGQIDSLKIKETRIVVLETAPTNQNSLICDQKTIDNGGCQSPTPNCIPSNTSFCQPAGFYEDDYTAGNSGPNTLTQQFSVDGSPVSVFWPQTAFDSNGFPYNVWYGALSQNATIDSKNTNGAFIKQNNPDKNNGASCQPVDCSTRRPDGSTR